MGLQIRCNCGWSSQVSEYYLGDAVCCPQCGTRISVHKQSGVPYGYAPYPTWRKKSPVITRMPAPRRFGHTLEIDTSSRSAHGLAWVGLLMTVTGCLTFPGVVLACVSLYLSSKARRQCIELSRPIPGRVRAAMLLNTFSIVIGAVLVIAMLADTGGNRPLASKASGPIVEDSIKQRPEQTLRRASDFEATRQPPEFRYQEAPSARPPASTTYRVEDERTRRIRQVLVPASPDPQPEPPVTDFERYQSDYSRKVAAERTGR